MKEIVSSLTLCPLFKSMSKKNIEDILNSVDYKIKPFNKGQLIAVEGDDCLNIGIILDGSVEIKKIFASGRSITVASLKKGNIFGEVIIFSDIRKYPSTITAFTETKIMFISVDDVIKLCNSNKKFLFNFISLLSNRILMLNEKITIISQKSIRQKISLLLLEEFKKNKSLILELPLSRKDLAEYLGIPRPSLSREMIKMKNEGIIDFKKNTIKILNLSELENSLIE
ncbi:Crp/Fnr family transcriptional regulator [Thermovenabulum gondwanense]|uniref:Global nitrogen regulator n=1 Tax=Thermovenabulum gondwanense TaxID=520767 RepID=A0A162MZZ4_9FIRM|nr:Crp/Fnr family transcriptional regulator [Thermovenabulum gondwanense]KYO68616.1 Global nitrogen regulator [Thermovenabulum gondwanense]